MPFSHGGGGGGGGPESPSPSLSGKCGSGLTKVPSADATPCRIYRYQKSIRSHQMSTVRVKATLGTLLWRIRDQSERAKREEKRRDKVPSFRHLSLLSLSLYQHRSTDSPSSEARGISRTDPLSSLSRAFPNRDCFLTVSSSSSSAAAADGKKRCLRTSQDKGSSPSRQETRFDIPTHCKVGGIAGNCSRYSRHYHYGNSTVPS